MNIKEQLQHCLSLDIETTGLDPIIHGMHSVGVCLFNGEEFYEENYLRDGAEIHPKALEVNGENEEDLKARQFIPDYLSEYQSLLRLIEFCQIYGNWVIVGKNPKFDYSFLKEIWIRNGETKGSFPFTYRVINYADLAIPLMLLAGLTIPENGFSSSDIQDFLNIPEEPKPHNGLTGARYNVMCMNKMMELYKKL
jgi:DNA polymerase III alpha subunit (gram-positive type)